jgi:predicted RNase H-like HicB family nuclease
MTGHPHTFTVVLEHAEEGGFIVTVPALPEFGTQGDTYDEAMANAREAIELVIEDRLSPSGRARPCRDRYREPPGWRARPSS